MPLRLLSLGLLAVCVAWLAVACYALAYLILPKFLFLPVAGVLGPVSAAVGVAYAWKYNKKGARQKILPEDPSKPKK